MLVFAHCMLSSAELVPQGFPGQSEIVMRLALTRMVGIYLQQMLQTFLAVLQVLIISRHSLISRALILAPGPVLVVAVSLPSLLG